jgi:hypothetical protein
VPLVAGGAPSLALHAAAARGSTSQQGVARLFKRAPSTPWSEIRCELDVRFVNVPNQPQGTSTAFFFVNFANHSTRLAVDHYTGLTVQVSHGGGLESVVNLGERWLDQWCRLTLEVQQASSQITTCAGSARASGPDVGNAGGFSVTAGVTIGQSIPREIAFDNVRCSAR